LKSINIIVGHKSGGILDIYKTLSPYLKDKFIINSVTFNYKGVNDILPEINNINFNVNTPINLWSGLKLFFKIVFFNYGGYHNLFIINNPSTSIIFYLASLLKELQYIVHVHEPFQLSKNIFIIGKLYSHLLNKTITGATQVICISESVKSSIPSKLIRENVNVIYNPINTKKILKLSASQSNNLFDNKYFNFVSVGRLSEAKGYSVLLNAIKLLKTNCKVPFRVYVIGDGEELKSLVTKANALSINELIYFVGYKENPFPYINQCDCYLSTSLWEGLGLTILYAMVLERQILASQTGGAVELLSSSNNFFKTGDPVDLSNAMKNILCNPKVNSKIIRENYEKTIDFEVDKISKKFINIFEQCEC